MWIVDASDQHQKVALKPMKEGRNDNYQGPVSAAYRLQPDFWFPRPVGFWLEFLLTSVSLEGTPYID